MPARSYLLFEERPPELGVIRWFARWRQYVFQPASDTVFNPVCMREIADKSYSLTLAQRAR